MAKKQKEKTVEEVKCMCHVHIAMEAGKDNAIPCIGHGKDCPCTALLEAKKLEEEKTPEPPAELT